MRPETTRRMFYLTAAATASQQRVVVRRSLYRPTPHHAFARITQKWVAVASRPAAWRFTHRLAREVRNNPTAAMVRGAFAVLDRVIAAMRARGPVRFDHLWPVLEAIEQIAAIIAGNADLCAAYVDGCAALVARHPDPAVVSGIAWSVNELLERGPESKELARRTAEALVEVDSSDITMATLLMIAESRPKDRALLPLRSDALSPAGWMLVSALLHVADEATAEVGAWVDDPRAPLDRFTELLSLLYVHVPFMGLIAMAALKLVFVRLLTAAKFRRTPMEPLVIKLCTSLFDEIDHHADAAFLVTEACEAIRDKQPRACALAMVRIFRTASPRVRQGIAICVAEGYEEDFGGALQRLVPRFIVDRAGVRFNTAAANDLDVFGTRVAALARSDRTIYPHLAWMNERLAGWLS